MEFLNDGMAFASGWVPPLLVADMTECMRKAKLPVNAVGSLGGPKADGTKVRHSTSIKVLDWGVLLELLCCCSRAKVHTWYVRGTALALGLEIGIKWSLKDESCRKADSEGFFASFILL